MFQFHLTCEALLATLIMFDVNNHQVISARGFVTPRQLRLRLDIVEATLKHFAETLGFDCEEVTEPNPDSLNIKVKISGERNEGPSEIFIGGSGWTRRYIEDRRTEESPIRNQAYCLLQTTLDVHESYDSVILEVFRADGSSAGRIIADRTTRKQMYEGEKPIEEIRTLLDEDTLPDETMPVIISDVPRPV